LRSNEKMYRTAVFAVKDGAISCSQPFMEELTSLTYDCICRRLGNYSHFGQEIVRIDSDLEGIVFGHF